MGDSFRNFSGGGAAAGPAPRVSVRVFALAVSCAALAAAASGCTAPRGPLVVTDPDPSVKIPAIKKAVRLKDRKAVKQLVADLENDDPAVRFYAINGLHRITGQRLGYDYYAAEEQRGPAVQRWRQWLDGQDNGRAWATTSESGGQ